MDRVGAGIRCQRQALDIHFTNRHRLIVRTTLDLDDDLFEWVSRRAEARKQSLGTAVSDLVRRGLQTPTPTVAKEGLVIFQLPSDSPRVTTEDVRRIEFIA